MWSLKSLDVDNIVVVKLRCSKCLKDFRPSARDHSKVVVHNLFMNFKKSHIVSIVYICNCCSHPQGCEI